MTDYTQYIDVHAHLLNYQTCPGEIWFKGHRIDLERYSPVLYALMSDAGWAIDAAEAAVKQLTGAQIDSEPLLKVFFTPIENWPLMKPAPFVCRTNLMTIETDESDENSLERILILEKALNDESFVSYATPGSRGGVARFFCGWSAFKLYPAAIQSPRWSIECTARHYLPIITHCSPGGIGQYPDHSDPRHFFKALQDNPRLRVCFAHGGGHKKEWIDSILKMALEFRDEETGGPRVFIDTAFHNEIFSAPKHYKDWLNRYMDEMPDGVLFGSDWPLHLIYGYSQKDLIDAHIELFGEETMDIIGRFNPEYFFTGKCPE